MIGFRTFIFNLLAAILPVLQTVDVTALSPHAMGIYGVAVGAANIALRAVTTTAIFQNK